MINEFDTIFLMTDSPDQFVVASAKSANRASFFGDGLFETMIYTQGKIRFAESHWARLKEGMKQLRLSPDLVSSITGIEQFLQEQYHNKSTLRVRWNVYRDGLGKYSPSTFQVKEFWMVQPHQSPPKIKKKSYISPHIQVCLSPWSHCKTLNALPYVMAGIERMEEEMDEVILLDNRGFISEAGASNIFWVKEGRYYTPSLGCGCIGGVGRKAIIHALKSSSLSILEGEFLPQELTDADQVFTSNVTGISYLQQLGDHQFDTTEIALLEDIFK